jgi:DNA-binding HxlR family transcriptional regulator
MKTETESCATLNLLHILGKRWSIPVIESISALGTGTSFNAVLLSLEEITPRGLSTILGEFSDAGIVKKSEYKKNGATHIKYTLTKNGVELEKIIKSLKSFGTKAYGTSPLCSERKCAECYLFLRHNPQKAESTSKK